MLALSVVGGGTRLVQADTHIVWSRCMGSVLEQGVSPSSWWLCVSAPAPLAAWVLSWWVPVRWYVRLVSLSKWAWLMGLVWGGVAPINP